jgi:peptidoglycan biosynthesis protein MviN/MurJ (putative lipid II flippase)
MECKIISILLSLLLVPTLKHKGTALSSVLTETFVSFSMLIFLREIQDTQFIPKAL